MSVNSFSTAEALITQFLTGPVEEFLARPKKELRGEMVKIGFLLYATHDLNDAINEDLTVLSSALEWIHAGSLIVDDIQDDSEERRGEKCLHRMYGIPCALNAANWMYFEALKKINEIKLSETHKFKIMTLILEMMSKAHQGQALDIMANIHKLPRHEVYQIGMKGHDLKSGAIIALALQIGAVLANEHADLQFLGELGKSIGSSLQRFDDLGNLSLDNSSPKALEDLKLGRPTWPWMYLAEYCLERDYYRFQQAVKRLPQTEELRAFLEETKLREEAIALAQKLHHQIFDYFVYPFPGHKREEGLSLLKLILQKVSHAYI